MSTHLTEDVDAICERVIVLSEGSAIFSGPVADFTVFDDKDMLGHTPMERAYMNLLASVGSAQ